MLTTPGQTPAPPPPPAHTCPTAIATPNAAATSADHPATSAASDVAALPPAATAAHAPPLVTNHSAAAPSCSFAHPPPPALAATPAIPFRPADLNLSSKCIETWSQAANGNFRHAVVPAAPLGNPPPLATSRPVDTAASASTNAVPSEPANVQGSTGTVNAHSSATAQRTLSQKAEHAFWSQWDANLAPPPGATTGYAADGATSSAAHILSSSHATGPANMGQVAAHTAILAATALPTPRLRPAP